MPTPYLQKVSEEHHIALKKLEEYWAKAKTLAKKRGDLEGSHYWAYVMKIFQNMAHMNSVSVDECYEVVASQIRAVFESTSAPKLAKPKKPAKPANTRAKTRPAKAQVTKAEQAKKAKGKKAQLEAAKRLKAKRIAKEKAKLTREKTKSGKTVAKKPSSKKAVKLPEWWMKKTETAQKKYIEKYPGSKFADKVAKSDPKMAKIVKEAKQKAAGKKPEAPPEPKEKLDVPETFDEPDTDDLDDTPAVPETEADHKKDERKKSKFEKGTPVEVKHKSLFSRLYMKSKLKINHTLKKDQIGRHCVGKFLTGHKLSKNEHEHMMNWVGTAAKLVVGVAVGVALFTPLAGLAPELGKHFLGLIPGLSSESADSDEPEKKIPEDEQVKLDFDPKNFKPSDFTDAMHDWLMKQDIPQLVEKLKEEGTV